MEITVEQVQGNVVVTILRVEGNLDGSSYQSLIAQARKEYAANARNFLIDLSQTPFMSSAGLVALYSIVKLTRGENIPDPDTGWNTLHALEREDAQRLEQHVKLLSPQPRVAKVLELAGVKTLLPIYTDRAAAITSF